MTPSRPGLVAATDVLRSAAAVMETAMVIGRHVNHLLKEGQDVWTPGLFPLSHSDIEFFAEVVASGARHEEDDDVAGTDRVVVGVLFATRERMGLRLGTLDSDGGIRSLCEIQLDLVTLAVKAFR